MTLKQGIVAAALAVMGLWSHAAAAQSVQAFYLEGRNGMCVDVPHGRTQVGIGLIIWECRNRLAQGFVVDTAARKIRFRRDPNLCVDQSNGAGENRLVLVFCDNTWNDWVYNPRTGTVSAGGKCWDVAHVRYTNGNPMIAYRCHGGANQKFVLDTL